MKFDINFTETPKLLIDNRECIFEQEVTGSAFQTNKSSMNFKNVHWKSLTKKERMVQPFIVPTYSVAKLYFGNSLFFYGIAISLGGGSLSPFIKKHANIKIISIDTFLSEGKFMDFAISDEEPETVVDKVLSKLNVPNIIKGNIHFQDNIHIKNYNLQDKTAYAGLDIVARQTNSTMVFGLDSNENITINYYSKDYLEKFNKGEDIDYTDETSTMNFWNKYGVRKLHQKEINVRTANVSRMYSDNILSTIEDEKVIDLSALKENETTKFPIGKITSAEFIQNGSLVRKLIFITNEQEERNKQSDIVYTPKENGITLKNDFGLLNQNTGLVKIKYLPIVNFSHQTENKSHQSMILSNTGLEGELTRVEKRNDLTEATDIIAQNEHALTKYSGIHKALELESQEPIWELGETTNFISSENMYKEIVGNYKVKSINFSFTLNDNGKLNNSVFKYQLIKSLDFETGMNFYDTKQYKQNNTFGTQVIFDLRSFETAEVILTAEGFAFCEDLDNVKDKPLESKLEHQTIGYKKEFKVITL